MGDRLREFLNQMEGTGVWVVADASPMMQRYVKKLYPDPEEYKKEIVKYMTPQKYIKRGREITVVSLTEQIWGGIRVFDEDDIVFKEIDGVIHSLQDKKSARTVVSAVDYQQEGEEHTIEGEGITVMAKDYRTKKEFVEKMLESGYLTKEEYEYYSNPENFKNLKVIKTVNY